MDTYTDKIWWCKEFNISKFNITPEYANIEGYYCFNEEVFGLVGNVSMFRAPFLDSIDIIKYTDHGTLSNFLAGVDLTRESIELGKLGIEFLIMGSMDSCMYVIIVPANNDNLWQHRSIRCMNYADLKDQILKLTRKWG